MKFFLAAAALATSATLVDASPMSSGSSDNQFRTCTARVLYSERLPYAPEGQWLVNVTLEIRPPGGITYVMTLRDWMPWQAPPWRRGQAVRLLCDPAHPGDLRAKY